MPEFGIEFGFKDKLAPRIGAAYDLKGDGRSKVFGSWGVFYDIFKLELPRGSFGGDKWLEYYYALDTYDWTNLVRRCGLPAGMPGHTAAAVRLTSAMCRSAPTASIPTSSRCVSRKPPSDSTNS